MEKILLLGQRAPGLDRARFDAAWHVASVALMARAGGLPGLVRHVRNQVVAEVTRDHLPPGAQGLDVIDELWFVDAHARDEAMKAVQAWRSTAPILPGEICLLACSAWLAFQRPPAAQGCKRLSLLTRLPDLSRQAFTDYWQHVHAPLAACHRHVQTYVQNHVRAVLPLSAGGDALAADGVGEFLISDLEGMQQDYRSEAGVRMKADVHHFIGSARTYLVNAQELPAPPPA